MDIREEMELDEIKREERLQQFIKEERARVLARRKAIAEKKSKENNPCLLYCFYEV